MREENVQRNSRKRLNALILLVAFTAILLIVSTYAWFSTQRNVTLGGLTGVVNVAEGLQISLDAKNWSNEIDLSDDEVTNYLDEGFTLENPYTGRTNVIPEELLPASTTATGDALNFTDDDSTKWADIAMYRGENSSGNKLDTIIRITDADAGTVPDKGYYAIDFFLQNSSAATVTMDYLQLQPNSDVQLAGTKYATGLQNTLRVAFAKFNEDTAKASQTVVQNTPTTAQILEALNWKNSAIEDVAIWEPNASGAAQASPAVNQYAAHVDYIVQNNNKLTLSATDRGEFALDTNQFAADDAVPTYALTETSVGKNIADLYYWDSTQSVPGGYTAASNGLVRQYTLQTTTEGVGTGVDNLDPVQLVSSSDGETKFTLAPGKYIKMRMYVWLEGQDVDCINYASLGGNITLDVGLSKPAGSTDPIEEEP